MPRRILEKFIFLTHAFLMHAKQDTQLKTLEKTFPTLDT